MLALSRVRPGEHLDRKSSVLGLKGQKEFRMKRVFRGSEFLQAGNSLVELLSYETWITS
jgi:hypothetical protein